MKDWKKKMLDLPELDAWDSQLSFNPPEILEQMRNACNLEPAPAAYAPCREYSHLKDVKLDLGHLGLTDRQLLAVSLVFYGRVAKSRAARAMKISPQSLSEHLQAALKKIQKAVG
jgi:predicted DNA-binding protein (UPF0251 family)